MKNDNYADIECFFAVKKLKKLIICSIMYNENLYHYEFYVFEKEISRMQVSYMKLQKLMVENQMKRNDLMRAAEISGTTATKINKNEPVSLEVLMRIA